jgi:hypothetical protein
MHLAGITSGDFTLDGPTLADIYLGKMAYAERVMRVAAYVQQVDGSITGAADAANGNSKARAFWSRVERAGGSSSTTVTRTLPRVEVVYLPLGDTIDIGMIAVG